MSQPLMLKHINICGYKCGLEALLHDGVSEADLSSNGCYLVASVWSGDIASPTVSSSA